MLSACQPVCSVPNYIFNSNVWGEVTEKHQDSCNSLHNLFDVVGKTAHAAGNCQNPKG